MQDEFTPILASVSKVCSQFEGGITAILDVLLAEEGERRRAKATLYSDLNPNQTSLGRLKARDMYRLMKIANNFEPLRIMAAMCGFSLISLSSIEPDSPSLEGEMLQDYPAVVAFHESIQAFKRGEISYDNVLAKMENATSDLRQTVAMARKEAIE